MTSDADTEPHAPRDLPGGFAAGMRAGLPVAVGYLPAAFAFGAAASTLGFSAIEAGAISAIVFSGANQVFLLAAIPAGMSLLAIIALTGIASLRHLLYGMVLRPRIGGTRGQRLGFALGLTDEVFATALAASARARPGSRWLWGLAFTAWAAWASGSVLGAGAGAALRAQSENAAAAMGFALPALFLALSLGALRREVALPMALAAVIAALALRLGQPGLAIPAGALACLVAGWRR